MTADRDAAVSELVAVTLREGPKIIAALADVVWLVEALRAELGCADDTAEILAAVRRLKAKEKAARATLQEIAA